VIYQAERVEGEGSEFGLGNFTYQAFFSPATPGKVIWAVGPALVFPTNTDERLGGDKWSAGPVAVALAKPGPCNCRSSCYFPSKEPKAGKKTI